MSWFDPLLLRGFIPDPLVRLGIRSQLRARLRMQRRGGPRQQRRRLEAVVTDLGSGPIAEHTDSAKDQHYEVPPAFFAHILGARWKYSSGYWIGPDDDLDRAEENMLELCRHRAEVADGQRILDLGCGWGSMAIWLAERLPRAEIVAVANSAAQIETVRARAAAAGLANLEARRADVNSFAPNGTFDRIVSIEMFEHMSNYHLLLQRVADWLRPGGKLFVHHFAHARFAYPYDSTDRSQWMARHFFTGGLMPSTDLLEHFPEDMRISKRWSVDGRHYQKTCEAWLANMDRRRREILKVLERAYGRRARRHWHAWRVFFMACAELFGYRDGNEWLVAHALLEPTAKLPSRSSEPVNSLATAHRDSEPTGGYRAIHNVLSGG